ncbi:hypothetical protein PENANT_c002G06647 [Penicillium antarcticum]|uniref:Extracellular membrane protein CFEM domain-containing protein n=1 Tax=Penicillium antarcticum TaxID=416450 RepID=A0A1V6QKK4_9EURO|nr:uncharacterized protein N7508_008560 [Penicillium antarcticum]KAJ5293739.1 hypothetical protein N7508_008560 [Penicillium antarcticum]OQD89768.1 hypothetical protein PENANT_c002G06647 [Penicillium antarcticum]
MRYFITATVLIGAVAAQTTSDVVSCIESAIANGDTSFSDCDGKSAQDCACSNSDAFSALSNSTEACTGIDLSKLTDSLCADTSSREATPFRHASAPMERVQAPNAHMNMNEKRAYAPAEPAMPRVVYVTETRTECSCKATPTPSDPMAHISQIPVDVPASSSMGAMMAASSGAMPSASYSHGMMVNAASSSVVFGSQASAATPSPSGVDANRFNSFQGAGTKSVSVHGGVAALGVAAVMALMAAL